jgi:pimeloyl-ACP methyl ester carboxylesterase
MGGAIALTLALDNPERVAGIGLISSGPRLPIASYIMENSSNPATYPLAVRSLYDLMHISRSAANIEELAIKKLSSIRQTLFQGDLYACDQFDVSTRLEAIETPALVVCGAEDKLTPRRYSECLAGQISGAALQTIDAAGHLVMLEQPRRVAGLLSVFLMTLPYSSGM